MLGNVTAEQLANATFAHPTLAETLGDLLRE
jgi:pyruvate/2-oxoglutarate dehydrogenase complex dihydrolipoamide dehydrogenase (E3) component